MTHARRLAAVVIVLLPASCTGGELRFHPRRLDTLRAGSVQSGLLSGRTLLLWGSELSLREYPRAASTFIPVARELRSAALMDVDGDGRTDVVAGEAGQESALVWFAAPRWERHVIDTGIDAADLLPAAILGRRGIVLIHKRMQVRFYEAPPHGAGRWHERDIYSVYTPSWQGGLLMTDVDHDGKPDILCGNYWIRSPASFELPWRLFAINTWTELPPSGMMRLVYTSPPAGPPTLIAAQRQLARARLSVFQQPPDPAQLWPEMPVADDLSDPDSLATADFDGDGLSDILVAERAGQSRLIVYRNRGNGRYEPTTVHRGVPVLYAATFAGSETPGILMVTADSVWLFENLAPRS